MPPMQSVWAWIAGHSEIARIVRFVAIGGISTLIYAAVTLGLANPYGIDMNAALASCAGYAVGAVFSYVGHRTFTFMSQGSITFEAPRFLLSVGFGMSISIFIAYILTEILGAMPLVPVTVCVALVPIMNFVILRKWVFISARPAGPYTSACHAKIGIDP